MIRGKLRTCFVVILVMLFAEGRTEPLVISAHPAGEASSGSLSLSAACVKLKELCQQYPDREKVLELSAGTYRLSEPLVFDQQFCGTKSGPVIVKGAADGETVISGLKELTNWTAYDERRWCAPLPDAKNLPQQFFVKEQALPLAREPDNGYFYAASPFDVTDLSNNPRSKSEFYVDISSFPELSKSDDPWLIAVHSWTVSRHKMDQINRQTGLVKLASETKHALGKWDIHMPFWLEGYVAAVDEPGEWAVDKDRHVLVYYPRKGEEITSFSAEIPLTDTLVELRGGEQEEEFLRFFSLNGLTFLGANWSLARDNSSDGQNHRSFDCPGVYCFGVENVSVTDSVFTGMGGYALWFDRACRKALVRGNEFRNNAAGGIRVGSNVQPEEDELLCRDIRVENNFLTGNGRVFRGSSGIWFTHVFSSTIAHNEICYQPYSGISVGWGWDENEDVQGSYSNTVCYNYIHHLGDGLMSDLGGIYMLSRSTGTEVFGNAIHNIRALKYGGFGIYSDAGSADIIYHDNLVAHTSSAGLFRNYGRRLVFRNNVVVDSGDPGLISMGRQIAKLKKDVWLTSENNVFYSTSGVDMIAPGRFDFGPVRMRNNLYWSTGGVPGFVASRKKNTQTIPVCLAWAPRKTLAEWQQMGFDQGSKIADPYGAGGVPANYRLPADSPARVMGCGSDEFLKAGRAGHLFADCQQIHPYQSDMPAPEIPAIQIQDGFERAGDEFVLPAGTFPRMAQMNRFALVDDAGKGNVLKMTGKTANGFACEPHIAVQDLDLQFEFKLSQNGEFSCVITEPAKGQAADIFRLEAVSSARGCSVNGKSVCPLSANVWYAFRMMPQAGSAEWHVELYQLSDKKKLWQGVIPFYADAADQIDMIGFFAGGDGKAPVFLDNLVLKNCR